MAAAKKAAAKKKSKPAPEPEVEETELEETDDELEELDEDEAEDTPPAKKSAAQEVIFGVSDLAKHLATKSGKKVTPRELRTLIRKMARDDSGRVEREITPGNRTRYNWSGLKDPEVKAIIAAFNSGELEADKQAKLAELKERKAAKDAAKKKAAEEAGDEDEKPAKKAAKKTGKKKAKPEPEPVEDDEDLELEDDDEDED